MDRNWIHLTTVVALVACSTPAKVEIDATPATSSAEVASEFRAPEVLASADLTLDLHGAPDILEFDVAPEVVDPGCQPGDGCFLDPCAENGQCQSSWCVEHMGDGVCTQPCQDECPPGWTCKQVAGTDPDLVFVCASDYANLCKPCQDGNDCVSPSGVADVCVDYGGEGSFCGGACAADGDCPWGFSCAQTVTVDGIATSQCVADAGVCPCTEKSVTLGLWTPCETVGEFGSCLGKRICTEDGLSACDAASAMEESCNGLDDDCDGAVDEPLESGGNFINLCDDGNECTSDTCLGEMGCQNSPEDGTECKDGDICTVADHCIAGECVGDPVICDDDNPCTDNFCTENGGCEYEANQADCDDGDPCTVADECNGGFCAGTQISCECDVSADCGTLEDGDLCNGTLVCDTAILPHQCKVDPDTVVTCPTPEGIDAICLKAQCDGESGICSLVADHEAYACDDGDACTIGDKCLAGSCAAGAPLNCNDGDVCTDDSCDAGQGCEHTNNAAPCDDGDLCTLGDKCDDGACQPGEQTVSCDDGNICTKDVCENGVGCTHTPGAGACDDGDACTVGDICKNGNCAAGEAAICDDGNICTSDSCDPATGCSYALNAAPCNDGNLCTIDDHCHLGECIGGGDLKCNDGSGCTEDSCLPEAGCKFTVVEEPCCSGGTEACGEVCVNTAFDPSHCGDCFKPCGPSEVCVDGDCKSDCAAGQEKCGDQCTNTAFDPDNCGECGKVCEGADNAVGICVASECTELCQAGFADCNLDMGADGCEVNLLSDPEHCGFCGDACEAVAHGTKGCDVGECTIAACDNSWLDCDGILNTGCEVDTKSNAKHCGECDNDCGQGFACINSECVEQQTSFIVMAEKDITFNGVNYLLLKVGFASLQSQSENWCYEYRDLCQSYGLNPTGCGMQWNSSFYKVCRDTYGSVTYDNSLSCNPSGPISQAAQANGFGDANGTNSFGYHYCDSSCAKTLCSGNHCHTALSYIDATKSHGYTLCIK